MNCSRDSLKTWCRPRVLIPLVLVATSIGCGGAGPGPSPTPEGQVGPGEPDASGLPKLPAKAGGR